MKGTLMLSGINLLTDAGKRPEGQQLLHSLLSYMNSARFEPAATATIVALKRLQMGH